jgi:hypothetical protein
MDAVINGALVAQTRPASRLARPLRPTGSGGPTSFLQRELDMGCPVQPQHPGKGTFCGVPYI